MMIRNESSLCNAYVLRLLIMVAAVLGLGAPVWAAAEGTISGTVSDLNGTAVPAVVITATNSASGAAVQTKTDDKGFYSFQSLPVGRYDLTIEMAGSKPATATNLLVESEAKLVANARVEPAVLTPQQQPPMPNMPNMPAQTGTTPVLDAPVDSTDPQALLDRIKLLEQRLGELETSAVLSEPETRVRRVEVYVDESGNEHDQPVPGARRTVTYQRERTFRRQTINEKIEEAMDDAANSSVQVGVDASITAQFAKQTKGETTDADSNAYELASADLFFTARVAQNTLFFADVVGLSGPPPDLEIGGLTLLNGYTARLVRQNELNLREAWLRTELFGQRLSLTAGRLDLTNYFDHNNAANDETTQFISDALVNNPMLGLVTNGAGVSVVFDPKIGFNFKLGFQQSNTEATNLSDSMFSMAEIGYLATPFSLGEGNYRVWYRTDNSVQTYRTGYGLSFDQKLMAPVTLFGRFGSAEADVDRDYFYSGGLQFSNGLGFYPGDAWGVGYAHTDLAVGDKERLVEGYYNFGLTERLRLSFHLQHVLEAPAGAASKLGFLVPGVRLQASF